MICKNVFEKQTNQCYTCIAEVNMLAIRLPSDIESRLGKLAEETGRTKTFYARQAILAYIDDLEDIFLAEKRLEDLRTGRSESIALEDVMSENGLANKI
jgi:RHH-type rel operon transcriptional repressor/antitoxin RelB